MNIADQFLWVIYPYIVITIFVAGHIFRYNSDQYGWTSKSSEFLEKRVLRWGSLLFHWGIIFVFFGHIAGLLIPISVYRALGIPDEVYHALAVWVGGPAGYITMIGVLILLWRRFAVRRIRLTSSTGDIIAVILLTVTIITGTLATTSNAIGEGFDYRTTINPWLRGILSLQPDATLMQDVPLPFKIHIFSAFTLFAIWPFTRLVHVFSLPITYLRRSYVLYRKRNVKKHEEFKLS